MDIPKIKRIQRARRHGRIRKKVNGTPERPRLCVFRSLKNMYVQIVDDSRGHTLASACTAMEDIRGQAPMGGNVKAATLLGAKIAELAQAKGIRQVCFDRGGYRYHGRIKALADAARKSGLKL